MATASLTLGACGRSSGNNSSAGYGTSSGDVAPGSGTNAAGASAPISQVPAEQDTTAPAHHSKLAGALVGAAAGHMLGHHALAGAAAGALVQHERNKHQR
jgi:hypothetical protein